MLEYFYIRMAALALFAVIYITIKQCKLRKDSYKPNPLYNKIESTV